MWIFLLYLEQLNNKDIFQQNISIYYFNSQGVLVLNTTLVPGATNIKCWAMVTNNLDIRRHSVNTFCDHVTIRSYVSKTLLGFSK